MGGDFYIDVTVFGFVLMRMTGMIFTNPLVGRSNFPVLFRAGFILAFTILVYSYTDVSVPAMTSFPEYVLLLLKEFLAGFVLSLVVNFFVYVISLAGEQMDMQLGLSMSAAYDPGSNISMSSAGNFYNILFLLTFFTTNSHLTLLRLFLDSAEVMPYGQVVINTELSETILDLFCQCTILGLKMALPLVFIELLVEIAIGTMMKAVPQIDVFVVNIQTKLVIGILFMFLTFQPMSDFIEKLISTMFEGLEQVLVVM